MFICKVASRCNLDCDYCYVYKHADQSWKTQPKQMTVETAHQLGTRIAEHGASCGFSSAEIVLHGGEPLLLGVQGLRSIIDAMQRGAGSVRLSLAMQTNGVLLDEDAVRFCREINIRVCLSADGPEAAQSRHRVDFAGKSSFAAVDRALHLLSSPQGRPIWSGVLSVVDLNNDPLEVYRYLRRFEPQVIEFLFPLAHHDMRPPGVTNDNPTPYADWLLKIFDHWYQERPQVTLVRKFRDIIGLSLGSFSVSEEWGLQPADFIAIETNGDIQGSDSLKITYPGAPHLGFNIANDSFDAVLQSAKLAAMQSQWRTLSDTCRKCELLQTCGGGYVPHRYSRSRGFENPSVYCADLMKLIGHVRARVSADLATLQGRNPSSI